MAGITTEKWWINRDAILISLSAFFADMGYQAILAGFPVLLVVMLKAPVYLLGFLYAITYGGGAIFGYVGGRLGDRIGRKKVAISGNTLILLLSGIGFAGTAFQAMALYITGWWSRDFRTPARRAMLSEAADEKHRRKAFGLLHMFDIGGGAIAVSYLLILLYLRLRVQTIFLLAALPLAVSTIVLLFVKVGVKGENQKAKTPVKSEQGAPKPLSNRDTLRGILVATALFGFSFYSLGFPILTIAQESGNNLLGILSYGVYLAFSALAGYAIGFYARKLNPIKGLSMLGYLLAAFASLLLAAAYAYHLAILGSYMAVALMGVAVGCIETFEPTIVSLLSPRAETGSKMGYLTSSRSIGLFIANALMGVLYAVSPVYSYAYAFATSLVAACLLLYSGRNFKS